MFEGNGAFGRRCKNTAEGKAADIQRNVEYLQQYIKGKPRTLYNIGVGHEPHNEAKAFKQLWPDIQIVGLEPDLKIFCDRVGEYVGVLYPWGLWKENGLCEFSISSTHGWSSLLPPQEKWVSNTELTFTGGILISCVTLDHLDEKLGRPQDIFLWMDIEGAELGALEGGKDTLASGRVKWIDVEVSHTPRRVGEPSEDMISEYLQRYGYRKMVRYGNAKTFHNVLYELKG